MSNAHPWQKQNRVWQDSVNQVALPQSQNPELHKLKVLEQIKKRAIAKELEIRHGAAACSTPEPHYEKSFTVKPKKEEA